MVALEGAAEVRGLGVAELRGDDLHRVAGGEEAGGGGHALALEPFARGAAEFALAAAFELAHGDFQKLRGGLQVVTGALGERTPERLGGLLGTVYAAAGHGPV